MPSAVRRALPVLVLNAQRPLQLRAEGALRRLVTDRDADAAATAFRALEQAVSAATDGLSADATIAATVEAVLAAEPDLIVGDVLEIDEALYEELSKIAPTALRT